MRQSGFSYVVVMFLLAVLSVVSLRALESTYAREQRDKEAELLWRGQAYRNAIRDYYLHGPGTATNYPMQLQDLLGDARFTNTHRQLRKLYRDPMTADGEWGLVRDANGRVVGVRSMSQVRPIKQAGFPEGLENFVNAQHYSDWEFVYQLKENTNVPSS